MSESISHLSSFSILLPLVFALLFFQSFNLPYKLLSLLVFLGALFESAFYLFRGEFTMILLNIYTIIEAVLLGLFFYFIFESRNFKLTNRILLLSFIVIAIISSIFYYNIDVNNPATLISESLIVLTLTLMCFTQLIKKDVDNYYAHGETWIVIGLFFYFGGNIFTFSYSSEYFSESQNFKFDVWLTHSLINIVLNICLAIAFYTEKQQSKIANNAANDM